jgi:hypothetical protein
MSSRGNTGKTRAPEAEDGFQGFLCFRWWLACRRAEVSGLPPGVEGQAVAACDVGVALALSDKTVIS